MKLPITWRELLDGSWDDKAVADHKKLPPLNDDIESFLDSLIGVELFGECQECGLIHMIKKNEHVEECFECGSRDIIWEKN